MKTLAAVESITVKNRVHSIALQDERRIAAWLIACAATIFVMIVLGGVTRLTGSGLSIVDWDPIMGVIPPLTDGQWDQAFERYKAFPEYQKVNYNMDIGGFKRIFAFEYAHRLLGRLTGLMFFLPFMFFLLRGKLTKTLKPKLWFLFLLGGLQGFMGWYMVKSGLVDIPRVSQYRLTAHLGLAVVIYGYMLWLVFQLLDNKESQSAAERRMAGGSTPQLQWFSRILMGLIFLMILSGGLVAGIDAGFAYNTFPLMDGRLLPAGLYNLQPWWLNIFNDITTVQFNHRLFAYLITAVIIGFAVRALRQSIDARQRTAVWILVSALVLQFCLGVATLLMVVPVSLAAAHQAGAILLFSAALWVCHCFAVLEEEKANAKRSWAAKWLTASASLLVLVLPLSLYVRSSAQALPVLHTLGGDFTAQSTTGDPLNTRALRGKVVLLNFGYTRCEVICPTTLSRLAAVLRELPSEAEVVPLFVTLDPQSDDLAWVKNYLANFHSSVIGLRTSAQTAREVMNYYSVYRSVRSDDSIAHNNHIYLIDRKGQVRATFGGEVRPAQMREAVESLLAFND